MRVLSDELRGLASLTANACLTKERRTPFCEPMPALTDGENPLAR
jgi:hypothetical protein